MAEEEQKIIEAMSVAGLHFGALRSRRHPSTSQYVFGMKGQVEMVDLEKTLVGLETAKEFARTLAKAGKQILLVGNKNEAREVTMEVAQSVHLPYVALRWMGGTLTNFDQIKKRVDLLIERRSQGASGDLNKYTKRERGRIAQEVKDLERFFTGLLEMKQLPGALIVIDSKKEEIAVAEAIKMRIPVIALCNTDSDVSAVTYPIVGNDKAVPSIRFVLEALATAYKEAKGRESVAA